MTRSERMLFSALFFLSGAAGLVYEVCWTRLLRLPMGNTVYSLTAVLTAFMGGLALGSWLAGRWIDRRGRPLRIYALLEAAIGIFCLALPWLVQAETPLFRWAYRSFGDSFIAFHLFKFFACALVILIPATLMGATLPVLCRSFFDDSRRIGRALGWLYAINALGAVCGSLLAGFVLVPHLGQRATIFIGVATSLAVATLAWISQRRAPDGARQNAATQAVSSEPAPSTAKRAREAAERPRVRTAVADRDRESLHATLRRVLLVGYGLSGLAAMVLQIAWTRVLALAFGSSVYAFVVLVSAFILGLAAGSAVASRFVDRLRRPALAFALAELGIGFSALAMVPILQHYPAWMLRIVPSLSHDFSRFQLAQFGLVFVTLLLPTLCMGACLPLAGRALVQKLETAAESVSLAYSWNAVGTIVGAFMGGFVLLPWLGMQRAIVVGAALNLLVGVVLLVLLLPRRRGMAAGAAVVAAGIATMVLVPEFDAASFTSGTYLYADRLATQMVGGDLRRYMESEHRILFNREGLSSTITVKATSGGVRTLSVNGKADASDDQDMATQTLLAHVPALMHPAPQDIAVIGLASGVSAHAVAQHPTVRSIDCIEIDAEMPAATRFFEHVNGRILDDPRLHLIIQDGRNHLALTDRTYDVIISEPSNPWIAGIASLFTREFLESCRDRLRPGGVMCLWIHVYGLDAHAIQSVMRTFLEVFPEATMWESIFASDYQLVGTKGPMRVGWEDLKLRLAAPAVASDLARVWVRSPADFMLRYLTDAAGMRPLAAQGEVYRDDHNRLEFEAPRLMHQVLRLETLRMLQELRRPGLPAWVQAPPGGLDAADGAALETAQAAQLEFWQAVVARMNDRPEDAARLFVSGLEKNQSLRDAWPQLLQVSHTTVPRALAAGDTAAAIAFYERILPLHPTMPDLFNEYGVLLANRNQLGAAEERYRQALEVRPRHVASRLNLATALVLQGRAAEAEPHLQQVLADQPGSLRAQVMLGNLLLPRDPAAAETAYRAATTSHPETGQVWFLLGESLRQQNDCKGAVRAYEVAVKRDPELRLAHRALATCYRQLGQAEKAARALARAGLQR